MFFWYFGVPPLLPRPVQDWLFNHDAEFWAGMFALGVYHGARMSEVIRAGILSIPRTQFEAAQAMGLTTWQAYRLVILPIAVRLIVPRAPANPEFPQNSSVALTISVPELTATRQIETYRQSHRGLTAGTLIYLAMCLSIAWIMARVERRFAIPGMIARVGTE
jgi:ABC-type amino acid transport system permease subunit